MSQIQASTVRVFVTGDGEHYNIVDISRATGGQWIRHRILSKLSIPEEHFLQYSIHSEEGSGNLGEALSDPELFLLCQKSGNAFGELKFHVCS